MTSLPFIQVDAFADRPFTGNPAAVMPLDASLDDAVLQAIALENNLSETAFYIPAEGDADFELRWFTPAVEVALCGHATLASGHVVLSRNPSWQAVRFRTRRAGVLTVRRSGDAYAMDLPATRMRPGGDESLLDMLGVKGELFTSDADTAEDTAIVLLKDEAAVRATAPDYRALGQKHVMAIVTAPGDQTDVVSRVFVPSFGIDEDPVTGSAHAALTPFWSERLGRKSFSAFQASRRGGRIDCTDSGPVATLGGKCVTVVEGTFSI